MNYLTNELLQQIVMRDQATGVISSELIEATKLIAIGLNKKLKVIERDEAISIALFVLVQKWKKIKTSENIFSYLTTCLYNAYKKEFKVLQLEEKRKYEFFDEMLRRSKYRKALAIYR